MSNVVEWRVVSQSSCHGSTWEPCGVLAVLERVMVVIEMMIRWCAGVGAGAGCGVVTGAWQ